MKYFDLKNRPSPQWTRLAAAGLLAVAALASGCGGSDGATGAPGAAGAPGAPGATGPTGPAGADLTAKVVINSNATTPTPAAVADWQAMKPQIAITSVAISGTPVVKFTAKDAAGLPIVGLGSATKAATAQVTSLANVSFTLAKLVPGANNEPSKWVSYIVLRPPTVAEAGGTIAATTSCNNATGVAATWCGTYPAADNQGTLVDNGDGSYQYTFYRDVTKVASLAAGLNDTADGLTKKADLGDLTYDGTLTHRLGVIVSGNMPGTGTNTPTAVASSVAAAPLVYNFNMGYDFVPNGGTPTVTRKVVDKASCSACHDGKGIGHAGSAVNGWQVGRNDPNLCVTCHTDQIKYEFNGGDMKIAADGITIISAPPTATTQQKRAAQAILGGRAVGNYPNMIHKTHMGDELTLQGYNFNNNGGAQMFNTVGFPQSPANCTKCHDASNNATTGTTKTSEGDNWKKVPSMLACGACHDGINFATGQGTTVSGATTGHIGGAKANNAQCVLCHDATTIPVYHAAAVPTPNNAVLKAGVASISYDIKTATVNASGQPVVSFRIMKNGTAVTSLAVPALVTNAQTGAQVVSPAYEPIPGFANATPSLYVMFNLPEDSVTTPSDFNGRVSASLTNLLIASGSPKAGSITGPDSSGYFTATLTGDLTGQPVTAVCKQNTGASAITGNCVNPSPIVVPAGAKMLTAAIIGTFTQKGLPGYPYTLADVSVNPNKSASGGLIIKSMLKIAGNTRRAVVATANCATCHEQLGTTPEFHGGARNDATACAFCHTVNQAGSGGWAANASTFIHGIHGASKRSVSFTWHAVSATDGYWNLGYPGVLKVCSNCHLPNTVNFGATASAVPGLLWTTTTSGTTAAASYSTAPYISQVAGTNYGNNFSYTPAGAVLGSYVKSDGTKVAAQVAPAGGLILAADSATLVNSPISSACFSCHDTAAAKAHMTTNGGAIYEARATALSKSEACLTCHGQGREFDAAVVHQ